MSRLLVLLSFHLAFLVAILGPAVYAQAVYAQAADDTDAAMPDDAAADDAAADDAAADDAAENDAAADAPADEGAAKPKSKIKQDIDDEQPPTSSVVQSLLETKPQTPAERFRVASSLAELGYPNLAKPLLQQLLGAKLDDAALAELVTQFGTPRFLRFSRSEALKPEAAEFATAALAASDRQSKQPARLAALLPSLSNPVPEVRRAAIVDLMTAKEAGVAFLLHALAEAKTPVERAAITSALVELGSMSIGPLIGALESNDVPFKVQVISALGLLEADRAALYLAGDAVGSPSPEIREAAAQSLRAMIGSAPSRQTAAAAIYRQIQRYTQGGRPIAPDHEGQVTLWHWDDAKKLSLSKKYPADEVGVLLAAQLARSLYELEPDNSDYRRYYLMALLEAAKQRAGFDEPLPREAGSGFALAAAAGPDAVMDMMGYALAHNHLAAATAAAEVLSEIGTPQILLSDDGNPAPLVAALSQGDRRLRFAALAAVLKLDPRQQFAGSSAVTTSLGYFAASSATPRILIGHPRAAAAQTLSAYLAAAGYDAEVAYTGQDLLALAAQTQDVQAVFVYSGIDGPPVRQVLFELRRQPATARVPIGIIATLDSLTHDQRMSAEVPLTLTFTAAPDEKTALADMAKLEQLAGRGLVGGKTAQQQALTALQWIQELAALPQTTYDMRRLNAPVLQALYTPGVQTAAAAALAELPSKEGQRILIGLASERGTSLEVRQALAKALGRSIDKFGILLTTSEIEQAYERYNASETEDRDTQQVLAAILDALEAPTKTTAKTATETSK